MKIGQGRAELLLRPFLGGAAAPPYRFLAIFCPAYLTSILMPRSSRMEPSLKASCASAML